MPVKNLLSSVTRPTTRCTAHSASRSQNQPRRQRPGEKALDRGVSFLRSDYVAILEHMDHNIGQLVSVLDELGVAENTLIVFVSDNGGCTMEEGALAEGFREQWSTTRRKAKPIKVGSMFLFS